MLFHRELGVGPPLHFPQSSLFGCQIFKGNKMISHTKRHSLSGPSLGYSKPQREPIGAGSGSELEQKLRKFGERRHSRAARVREEKSTKTITWETCATFDRMVSGGGIVRNLQPSPSGPGAAPARRAGAVFVPVCREPGHPAFSNWDTKNPSRKTRDGLEVRLGSRRFASPWRRTIRCNDLCQADSRKRNSAGPRRSIFARWRCQLPGAEIPGLSRTARRMPDRGASQL